MSQPLSEGDRVPNVTFPIRVRDESIGGDNPYRWSEINSDTIFANKKVVLFALPGAFTPTCSTSHVPGYEALYDDFNRQGVDEVICLSVNDAFVMKQWADKLNVKNVRMLPDGNTEFTEKMGMLVEKKNLGFGSRSWRYAMYVENGVIVKLFSEAGQENNCATDPFEVSDAQTMLSYLQSRG